MHWRYSEWITGDDAWNMQVSCFISRVISSVNGCHSLSRPVLPDRELTKGGSAITSGCQQRAQAMKLRYVAWWWRSRERKPTGFRSGFGRCLASVSTSRQGSEKNLKDSGSGTRSRRDGENEGQRYGKYLS